MKTCFNKGMGILVDQSSVRPERSTSPWMSRVQKKDDTTLACPCIGRPRGLPSAAHIERRSTRSSFRYDLCVFVVERRTVRRRRLAGINSTLPHALGICRR